MRLRSEAKKRFENHRVVIKSVDLGYKPGLHHLASV